MSRGGTIVLHFYLAFIKFGIGRTTSDPSTLRQGSWRIAQDSAPSLGPWPRDLGRGIPSEVERRAHKEGPRAMPVGLHVAHEIRDGHLTRPEGVALVRRYDDEFPSKYFAELLEYLGIDAPRFWRIVERYRHPRIWTQVDGQWRLRHQVS